MVEKRGWIDRRNLGTIGRQAQQGATLGWADEAYDRIAAKTAELLTGKAKTNFSPEVLAKLSPEDRAALTGGTYSDYLKEARTKTRQDLAADWEQAPIISLAANVAGSIPLALSAPAASLSNWARANTLLGAAGKGAAVGAGYGAVAGAGSNNPDPDGTFAQDVWDRTRGAIRGSIFGGLLGAAGNAASWYFTPPGGTNLPKVGKELAKDKPTKAQKLLAEQLGARPDLQEQLARAEAMNAASQNTGIPLTLAEKIAQSPSDPLLAQQRILTTNPQTAGAMEALYAGRSGTIDAPGSIEQALLRQAKGLAPEAGSYDDVAAALIAKSKEAAKGVTKQLSDEAAPLYQEAFQANKSMQSPVFDKILDTPEGQKALSQAAKLMQNQMVRVAVPDAELTAAARDLQALGKVSGVPREGVASGLKMETLDNIKKGFDAAIDDALSRSSPGTTSAEARALMDLKSALVSEMDRLDITAQAGPNSFNPAGGAYARARGVYSGQPELLQMRERIGNVANIDPLQARQVGNQMFSGTQKNAQMAAEALGPENAKLAAAARIYDVMDTARGDPTSFAGKIAPDARTADMLRIYAGGNQLDDTLNVINQAKIGEKFRYGSPTQPLEQTSKVMDRAAGSAVDLAIGNKVGFVRKLADMFGKGEDPMFYRDMLELMTTDQGMDLVRQVAGGQGTAIQKQQASNAIKSYLFSKANTASQPLKNALVMNYTSPGALPPQKELPDSQIFTPEAQNPYMLPPQNNPYAQPQTNPYAVPQNNPYLNGGR